MLALQNKLGYDNSTWTFYSKARLKCQAWKGLRWKGTMIKWYIHECTTMKRYKTMCVAGTNQWRLIESLLLHFPGVKPLQSVKPPLLIRTWKLQMMSQRKPSTMWPNNNTHISFDHSIYTFLVVYFYVLPWSNVKSFFFCAQSCQITTGKNKNKCLQTGIVWNWYVNKGTVYKQYNSDEDRSKNRAKTFVERQKNAVFAYFSLKISHWNNFKVVQFNINMQIKSQSTKSIILMKIKARIMPQSSEKVQKMIILPIFAKKRPTEQIQNCPRWSKKKSASCLRHM